LSCRFRQDPGKAIAVSELIHHEFPETAIFAISFDAQPDVIIQAMRSGCSEYLFKPLAHEQFLQAAARVAGRRKDRKEITNAQVLTSSARRVDAELRPWRPSSAS